MVLKVMINHKAEHIGLMAFHFNIVYVIVHIKKQHVKKANPGVKR